MRVRNLAASPNLQDAMRSASSTAWPTVGVRCGATALSRDDAQFARWRQRMEGMYGL